jgi:hypothetical protein
MCDSRRVSARTARRNALREDRGRASDFSRLGFAETKKGPQSSGIISHPSSVFSLLNGENLDLVVAHQNYVVRSSADQDPRDGRDVGD